MGNTEIDVDIKRYYCKAGIKSVQVQRVPIYFFPHLLLHADKGTVLLAGLVLSAVTVRKEVRTWQMETFDGNEAELLGKCAGFSPRHLESWCYDGARLLPNKLLISCMEDFEADRNLQ